MAQPQSPSTPRSPKISYGYQPLCFHKDVFNSPNFNVDSFIADCRKRVPLESVRNDLRDYFSSLENELVELINKDYTDFVNLSSNLAGIDEVLNELRGPLTEIKDEAKTYNARIQDVIGNTESKMQEQQEIMVRMQYLQLFISISSSVDKLDHLLPVTDLKTAKSQPSLKIASPTVGHDFGNPTVYMDRLANEYNMLRFYLSQTQKFPSHKNLLDQFNPKITSLMAALDREVSRNFRAAITAIGSSSSSSTVTTTPSATPSTTSSTTPTSLPTTTPVQINASLMEQIGACLRLYRALNKASSAYAIYREVIVKPRVLQIVTVANLEKGSRGTCEGLKGILDGLLEFIKTDCCPFLEKVREITASEYDFLSNSIWIEIEEVIYTKIGKIYAPGIPEIFHQNYKACFSFLSQLESQACYDLAGLMGFRAHSSYQAFERRWNTSVYFQLRFTEIASKVEAALSQQQQFQSPTKPTTSEPSFLLVGSTVLWRELTRIWSPNVFLFELTRQFVKLTLQLLSRYSSWVYASYGIPSNSTQTNTVVVESLKNSATINLTENVDEPAAAIWGKLVPGAYAHLYHDLVVLVSNLQTDNKVLNAVKGQESLLEIISSALQQGEGCDGELVSAIRQSLDSASSALLTHQSYLSNAVTSNLTQKAIDSLQPLLGVTATYRLTDKRLPTRANYYVDDVVAVLHTFHQLHASYIPLPILQDWEYKILEGATTRYEEMVTETLNSAYSREKTLNKVLKKKTTQTGISDIDKVSLQLYLDVSQYGQLLKSKLNLDGTNFPPYVSLLAKVQDGAKFKNLVAENVQ